MFNKIIYTLFVTIGAINFLHLVMYLVGANLYDIKQLRSQRLSVKAKLRKLRKPLVSVIIPAHNEELTIVRCLDSVRRSTYRKIEVIVHNDRSTDATARILRDYKKKYKKFNLRVINRRINVGKGAGVNFAIKRYSKGELIMTLDADCILHAEAVKNAVKYFADERIVGVAANVRIMDSSSILGLLQKFEHLIGYRSKKFYTMTNSEFIVGGVASTYRRTAMEAVNYYDTDTQTEDIGLSMKLVARGNRDTRIIYASDVLAMTEGVQTFEALLIQRYRWKLGMFQNLFKHLNLFGNLDKKYSKTLTMYRIPMAFLSELMLLVQPLILTYVLFLSIQMQTTMLFFGAYVTITLYIMLSIFPDEHSTFKRKLSMTAYAPILYFVFYIMDLVQIISIFRVLRRPSKIMLKSETGGSWISPKRSGQVATF